MKYENNFSYNKLVGQAATSVEDTATTGISDEENPCVSTGYVCGESGSTCVNSTSRPDGSYISVEYSCMRCNDYSARHNVWMATKSTQSTHGMQCGADAEIAYTSTEYSYGAPDIHGQCTTINTSKYEINSRELAEENITCRVPNPSYDASNPNNMPAEFDEINVLGCMVLNRGTLTFTEEKINFDGATGPYPENYDGSITFEDILDHNVRTCPGPLYRDTKTTCSTGGNEPEYFSLSCGE